MSTPLPKTLPSILPTTIGAFSRGIPMEPLMGNHMKDAAFLAEGGKQNMDVAPVSGEAVEALLKRIYARPPEVVARAREITDRGRK